MPREFSCANDGCIGGIILRGSKGEFGEPVWNFDRDFYIHLRTNTFWKVMNQSLFIHTMGSIACPIRIPRLVWQPIYANEFKTRCGFVWTHA